jgi:hypothetical protein
MYNKDNTLISLFESLGKVDLSGVSFTPKEDKPEGDHAPEAPKKFEVTQELADSLLKEIGAGPEVNVDEFMKGLAEEQEHTDVTGGDPATTAKIALVHLKELPDYYTRLAQMVADAKKTPEAKPEKEASPAAAADAAAGGKEAPIESKKIKEQEMIPHDTMTCTKCGYVGHGDVSDGQHRCPQCKLAWRNNESKVNEDTSQLKSRASAAKTFAELDKVMDDALTAKDSKKITDAEYYEIQKLCKNKSLTVESKVNEQEPTKMTVIAADISDEAEAKKIQAGKPGATITQDPQTKKYRVEIKEGIETKMAVEYKAECKKYDLETADRQNYHEWVETAYPEYKDDVGTEERVMKYVSGIKEADEPVVYATKDIKEPDGSYVRKGRAGTLTQEKDAQGKVGIIFGKDTWFLAPDEFSKERVTEYAGREIADEGKNVKTGEFAFPVYEFGIELFGDKWELQHEPEEVANELETPKGIAIVKKWIEQEIKKAQAKDVVVQNVYFKETDSDHYTTDAGVFYAVALAGQDSELAKVVGKDKSITPVEEAKKATEEKGAR